MGDIAVPNDFDLFNQRYQAPKLCERLALLAIHAEPANVPQPSDEDVDYMMNAVLGFHNAK